MLGLPWNQFNRFCFTIRFVRGIFFILLAASCALSQATSNSKRSDQEPPVKVNILNVCTPDSDSQKELSSAMSRLPNVPAFTTDYEISRGVATVDEDKTAKYVRLRRDVKGDSPLLTIQYSLSAEPTNTVETLVFRGKDVKELLALSIEDKLSTSASRPSAIVTSDTPATRIRVERAGKTSLGLARCQDVDQSAYEPLFAQASSVLANYRRILKLRTMLASDLIWLTPKSEHERQEPKK